jgi:hypothetical protein
LLIASTGQHSMQTSQPVQPTSSIQAMGRSFLFSLGTTVPYWFTMASAGQTQAQSEQLMHSSGAKMRKGWRVSPSMMAIGHSLAHRVHPTHFSSRMKKAIGGE